MTVKKNTTVNPKLISVKPKTKKWQTHITSRSAKCCAKNQMELPQMRRNGSTSKNLFTRPHITPLEKGEKLVVSKFRDTTTCYQNKEESQPRK